MTCFGIHFLDEDYVIHGELEITRLDKDGKIVWQYIGRDIWTTPEGTDLAMSGRQADRGTILAGTEGLSIFALPAD